MEHIRYFDAHSHLNFSQFDEDRDQLIEMMRERGVWTITVGTNEMTSQEAIDLAQQHEHLFATVGLHPTDVEQSFDISKYSELAENEHVVGIGECGLDYFRIDEHDVEIKATQKRIFESHIELAHTHKLPLMLHIRPKAGTMDAYHDALEILESHKDSLLSDRPGNVHFFVGDSDVAKRFLDLGYTVSYDGPITFSDDYNDAVRYIPLDMLLAETDAPYAAPVPYRGKRNEPAYVEHVVEAIARIKKEDIEHVREKTVQNTLRVFNISV